ncbi:Protein CBG25798 [Caenorhabditis briggsae]|uniref:Protein CBG25798 n=1 Tax=Caenorhabditis briggsae TaxID=6238 RepID=B6IGM1_CAEBR|nr:Protein CBG25798 [Caenorhabditis briggsae]CAR99051.1 Protein CBG25798 [Caenorhabditis briggsae]
MKEEEGKAAMFVRFSKREFLEEAKKRKKTGQNNQKRGYWKSRRNRENCDDDCAGRLRKSARGDEKTGGWQQEMNENSEWKDEVLEKDEYRDRQLIRLLREERLREGLDRYL